MKLYLVWQNFGSYSHKYATCYGIFSSKERAERIKASCKVNTDKEIWEPEIKEIELDVEQDILVAK